ncbi:MAG: hypothetical protein P8090_03560 [Gammaproteobacteria bacterium]
MRKLVMVMLALALVAGCARDAARVSQPVRAASLATVAVLPFFGPHGELFADRINYELLQQGADVIPKQTVVLLLKHEKLGNADFTSNAYRKRILQLGRKLGADTVVVGSVTPMDGGQTVIDEMRGVPGYKVATATMQFIAVSDGRVVSSASYRNERSLALLAATYHDVAHKLVAAALRR